MLNLLMFLQLLSCNIRCDKIQPVLNTTYLKILNYDGEGIPDLVYCKVEGK